MWLQQFDVGMPNPQLADVFILLFIVKIFKTQPRAELCGSFQEKNPGTKKNAFGKNVGHIIIHACVFLPFHTKCHVLIIAGLAETKLYTRFSYE